MKKGKCGVCGIVKEFGFARPHWATGLCEGCFVQFDKVNSEPVEFILWRIIQRIERLEKKRRR